MLARKELWHSMDITPVLSLLKDRMGLNPVSIGVASLEQAVASMMKERGVGRVEDYVRLLGGDDAELQSLIESVVVCETSFFRDHAPFVALGKLVRNDWLPRRAGKSLRVLSVPCSTGEEPYSIAMVLLDAGLTSEQFHIDAVDISERALTTARRGIYKDYSFRGRDNGLRERYFLRTDDGYELSEEVRSAVNFVQGNLLDRRCFAGRARYDVIFCRNLLIYFDEATKDRVLDLLTHLLADDGVLFVGHAETARLAYKGFLRLGYPMSFGFTHSPQLTAQASLSSPLVVPNPSPAPTLVPFPPKPPVLVQNSVRPAAPPERVGVLGVQERIARAKALADGGDLRAAIASCEELIEQGHIFAEVYYLLGAASDATGSALEAEDYLKKAVYLDPEHHESLLYLSVLALRRGDGGGAESYRRRAERVAHRERHK